MGRMNRVVLVGRLGADPEVKVTPDGMTVCELRLAVSRVKAAPNGQDTDWFNVVCFRQTAEFAGKYLRKGYLIGVDGKVQNDEYETREGEKRYRLKIVADNVDNMQGKTDAAPTDTASARIAEAFGGAEEQRPFDPFAEA